MTKLLLPPKQKGLPNEEWEDVQSVVVIGANGSGKSRLGAWIDENMTSAPVHRVAAQRALSVPDLVNPVPYDRATKQLHYGGYDADWSEDQYRGSKRHRRWGNDPVGRIQSDYELVLSTLFADEAKRNRDYATAARDHLPQSKTPDCKLDVLQKIWTVVFPHRELVIGQDKIAARTPHTQTEYAGRLMSDGERVAFYLLGQSLCAPEGAIVVIDEPEIHLHKAVQAILWDQIEVARPDCILVYITHDLDFAGSRSEARKIWMKGYDGSNWEWEEIESRPELPEQLMLQVLGSRRPILFVEGDENSHDAALYQALYPEELVLPLANCDKVVEATKAMKEVTALHHLSSEGLIDRDHRSDDEIAALRESGLRVAEVAEVENLYCIQDALEAVATQLKIADVGAAVAKAKQAVLTELQKSIDAQIAARAISDIQFRLGGFGPKAGKADAAKIEAAMNAHIQTIDIGAIFARSRQLFADIISTSDYAAALRYYNCKGVVSFVAKSFGMNAQTYLTMINGLIKPDPQGLLASAMRRMISK